MAAFRGTIAALQTDARPGRGRGWTEFRRYQASIQAWVSENPAEVQSFVPISEQSMAPPQPSGKLLLLMQEIEAMKNSPFWRLRDLFVRTLRSLGLRYRG